MAVNMNVTPPDISGGILTITPTSSTSYQFTATVPASAYQYTGTVPNTNFFGDTLTFTSRPPKGIYGFVVDGIEPNATLSFPFLTTNTTLANFPVMIATVGPDTYFASFFSHRITKLTNGVGPGTTFLGSGSSTLVTAGTGTAANIAFPWGIVYDSNVPCFYVAPQTAVMKVTMAGVATIIAGSATAGYADGTGAAARFNSIRGMAVNNAGEIFVCEGGNTGPADRIRKIIPSTGVVTTFAGSGVAGYLDGTGTAARFNKPFGLIFHPVTQDLYVLDRFNYRLRRITPAGVVSTFAGSGVSGLVDGVGTAAQFQQLYAGITFRSADNCLYVTDITGRIRKVTVPGAVVTTLAGSGGASPPTPGINLSSTFNFNGLTIDQDANLLSAGGAGSPLGVAKIVIPTEVRASGSRPTGYTITATTGNVIVNVPTQIVPIVTNPTIVNGIATLYKYSPFEYTFSNAVAGEAMTVTTTPELAPFVTTDPSAGTASFSSTTGFLTSYSSVFPITFNALTGSNVTDTFSFNVQILPGRFTSPSNGFSNTFFQNEAITPILYQADISLTQIYSAPSLPPGLSFVQVDASGTQYQLQGTPTVTSPATAYNIVGRNTQTGRIVSISNVYRVDNERILLSLSGGSSNISNMTVGTPISTRFVTALYPTYGSFSFQYRWTQVLPTNFQLTDVADVPVVSGFSPTDVSSTIELQGAPSLALAQFLSQTSNSYPFTLNANLTRGGSNLTASIPFTFSFAETVLFTQSQSNVTLYLGDTITSNDGYYFNARTFFTPGTVNISSIFSPNLRSDLSLTYVGGSPEAQSFLSGQATFSAVDQPFIIRAVNSNGVSRDTIVRITTQPDVVTFAATDLCSTFIFSRPLAQAKAGYYNSPIIFRATATSGRQITYSDGGTLAGTGLSLSNAPLNSVRLVGTPTTTLPLTNLTVTGVAAETGGTGSTTVQFSIIPDSATWTVTPITPTEFVQNVETTPYQFRATTLSELPVAYYSATNLPVGLSLSSTGRLTGTPTIAGSGVATVFANTGASALPYNFSYTVLPDAILFTTPSNLYSITPGQVIDPIPITALSFSGISGSNFTLDPSGNLTYGVTLSVSGVVDGVAAPQIPPTLVYPAVPIPYYVSATAGNVTGTFSYLLGTNNPGPSPQPYLYFSNQTGPAFPPQESRYTLYQYAFVSITVLPPMPELNPPYLYVHPDDLPPGLQFNGLTGVISGYPTTTFFERPITVHALQRISQLVSSFTIYFTVLNPFIVRPQTSAAAYTALVRQYTLANATQNSRDYRVYAGAESNQGVFAAGEGTDTVTPNPPNCKTQCPPPGPPPAPAFDPLSLPGCALWLDAFDSADVSGSEVVRWNDKSGFSRDASDIVGTPLYSPLGLNGYPAVTLDICASLYGSLPNSNIYVTAFGVYQSDTSMFSFATNVGYHPILSTARANGIADVIPLAITGTETSNEEVMTLRSGQVTEYAITTPTAPTLLSTWYDGTFGNLSWNGNIDPNPEIVGGSFAYTRYGLGNNAGLPDRPTLPWAGRLGEILVYHTFLPLSNRQQVEGYLAWKWGLQSNLPSSHPYKNSPP